MTTHDGCPKVGDDWPFRYPPPLVDDVFAHIMKSLVRGAWSNAHCTVIMQQKTPTATPTTANRFAQNLTWLFALWISCLQGTTGDILANPLAYLKLKTPWLLLSFVTLC